MVRGENAFAQCSVAFAPSRNLAPSEISKLKDIVVRQGGEVLDPDREGKLPLRMATHVVASDINFEQYTEAQARMVPVVNQRWIEHSAAKGKPAQLRPYSPDPRMIFASVVITCIGLPEMDKESIIGATMALGGQESPQVNRQTTHICALTGEEDEVKVAKERGTKAMIVLPHWFDDCFKLNKRIDERPYQLPNAEILKSFRDSAIMIPSSAALEGATSAVPTYLPADGEDANRKRLTVFQRKKIRLAADLIVRDHLLEMLASIISDAGGEVVDNVDDCTTLVCQYRDGEEYVRAAAEAKEVGNLSWLFRLITTDEWSNPLHRLLHYPLPRDPLPGFEKLRICVSNYGGEARSYLENLVKAAGAEFTKTMKEDNTHLVTARDSGDKCEAARDWNIVSVNHIWLEESYAKGVLQSVSIQKYSHFPSRTNLGEVIGQTFFDEARLRETYYPIPDDQISDEGRRRRLILDGANENAAAYGPTEGYAQGREDIKVYREKARKQVQLIADSVKKDASRVSSGKENDTPAPRKSKRQAEASIMLMVDDIQQYERESKRRSKDGKGPWGGKRAADELDMAAEQQQPSKKAKVDALREEDSTAENKRRKPKAPKTSLTLLVTGYQRWISDKKREDKDRMKLAELGIRLAQETASYQYLAAPKIMRTMKFIMGLSRGATIISTDFLDEVLNTGKLVDPMDFQLEDEEYSKSRKFDLEKAVSRARSHKGKLLSGVPIYCTKDVKHGVDTFRALADANNAIFKTYDGKHVTIKKTTAEDDGNGPPDPVYLLSSHSKAEQHLYPKFVKMAKEGHCEPRIVTPDWLLEVVMRQELTYDKRFAVESW